MSEGFPPPQPRKSTAEAVAAATHRNRRASALLLLVLLFARCSSLLVETHAFLEDGGFMLTQTEIDLAEHVVELRDLGMRVLGSCDGHELVLGDIARVNTSDAMMNVGDLVAIYGDDCADARRDPRYVCVVDVEETHPERRRLQVEPATFDDVVKSGSVHGVLTAPAHMAQGAAELLAAQVLGMPSSEQAFTVVGKPHGPSDGVMREYVALTLASADAVTGRRRVLLGLEPGDEVLSDVDLAFIRRASLTSQRELKQRTRWCHWQAKRTRQNCWRRRCAACARIFSSSSSWPSVASCSQGRLHRRHYLKRSLACSRISLCPLSIRHQVMALGVA